MHRALAACVTALALAACAPSLTRHPSPADDPSNPEAPESPWRAPTVQVHEPERKHAAVHACPMHPEVTSDRPGKCPKCGMALVPKESP